MLKQTYTLDMVPGGRTLIIPVSQYDHGMREILFNLTAGADPYTVPDGAAVSVRGTKRDSRGFAMPCTYVGSAVAVELRKNMTAVAGDTWCELRIVVGNMQVGSANFILRVEPSALSDNTDISATEIPAIEDAARANAERAEAAADRAEEAAAGGTGAIGVSPTVTITPIDGGNRITITDKNGAHTADVMNGKNGADGADGAAGPAGADGKNGADGVSPTVALTAISGGTRLTITDANGQHSADIMNGADGAAGAAGADGKPGPAGADGVSPTVSVAQTDTGATITITDKSGAHSVTLTNGKDGANGADGASPSVSVAQTSTGATITITDASGAHTATILNGADGKQGPAGTPGKDGADGKNGADGKAATVTIGTVTTGEPGTSATVTNSGTANAAILDFSIPRGATGAAGADGKDGAAGPAGADGVSPTVTLAAITGGTRLTITDANGDHSADILNGAAGAAGEPGPAGKDGKDGKNGTDGVSPTVSVAQNDTGATITITDKSGAHTATILNGAAGATGPAYTLTDSDKSAIASAVLAQMTNAETEAL